MKPVDQTKLHDAEQGIRGDCFRAAIASLLELPIEDVPPFEDYAEDWHAPFMDWAFSRDLEPVFLEPKDAPCGYSIASGLSPRGIMHSCLALDGNVVFDPHPSRAGLLWIRDYLVFESIAPCETHQWKWHRNPNTPDNFGESVKYCDVCGIEDEGD